MLLGGFGIIVAGILFFAWRKSQKGWQRGIAWIAGLWAAFSILFFVIGGLSLSNSAPALTSPPTVTRKPTIYKTSIPPTRTPTKTLMEGCPVNKTGINIRTGPGTQFAKAGTLQGDSCVSLVGRNEDGSWLFISSAQGPGWIKASLLSASGNIHGLPIQQLAFNESGTANPEFRATISSIFLTHRAPATQVVAQEADVPLCESLIDKIGQTVLCRVERAYCSYLPSVSGSPTFCNEAPYPNNYFTLVAWDKDWSDLNGHCLIIQGGIYKYEGGLQIEAGSRSQISFCD